MTRYEFISFIKELGFYQPIPNINADLFQLDVDDQEVPISFVVNLKGNSCTLYFIRNGYILGSSRNVVFSGIIDDFDIIPFMEVISSKFKVIPDKIIKFLRDKKIDYLLN